MTFQRRPTLPPSPEASLGDTGNQSLVAGFLNFNPRQYESNYHKQCLLIVTKFYLRSASDYKFHALASKYNTPSLPKPILYFEQLAEDLRNIFTSWTHARKSGTQPASSFPWFTSKTKRWNIGLILNIKFLECTSANISLFWSNAT